MVSRRQQPQRSAPLSPDADLLVQPDRGERPLGPKPQLKRVDPIGRPSLVGQHPSSSRDQPGKGIRRDLVQSTPSHQEHLRGHIGGSMWVSPSEGVRQDTVVVGLEQRRELLRPHR